LATPQVNELYFNQVLVFSINSGIHAIIANLLKTGVNDKSKSNEGKTTFYDTEKNMQREWTGAALT